MQLQTGTKLEHELWKINVISPKWPRHTKFERNIRGLEQSGGPCPLGNNVARNPSRADGPSSGSKMLAGGRYGAIVINFGGS